MAIITITRGKYSGGETLAEGIATALGARCVSMEVLIEAAKTFNAPEDKVTQVFDTSPSFWERMTESRRIYLAYVQAVLADWAKDDNLVYHGNAGQELLREVPHALKVWLIFPIEKRVSNVMEELGYARDRAERFISDLDESRSKRMRYLFNTDWRNSSRYDLVVRVDRIPPECAQEMILNLARRPEFQLDDAKRAQFNDFLLKCRVYALLAEGLVARLSLIDVTVADGVVSLHGTLTSHDAKIEQLVGQIEELEGVKQVINEIMVGVVYDGWNA
jgi:cytidylate kinase